MALSVPEWVFIGLAYTAGATTLAIAAFALGGWEFPANPLQGTRFGNVVGASRRRGNIRRYLDAITEPYVEDHVVHGFRCTFYLPDRDVALTLNPEAADRLRATTTYVVYCEPRMRADQLGERLPFETPSVGRGRDGRRRAGPGYAQGTTGGRQHNTTRTASGGTRYGQRTDTRRRSGQQVTRAFRTLGVSRDASEDEVKSAYREKVKHVHPDRGGSEEAFARVQEAYATAKEHAD